MDHHISKTKSRQVGSENSQPKINLVLIFFFLIDNRNIAFVDKIEPYQASSAEHEEEPRTAMSPHLPCVSLGDC